MEIKVLLFLKPFLDISLCRFFICSSVFKVNSYHCCSVKWKVTLNACTYVCSQLSRTFRKPFSVIMHSTSMLLISLFPAICIPWCDHIVEDMLQHSNNRLQGGEYALIWLQSSAPDDCITAKHASRWELTLHIHSQCWMRLWIYLNTSADSTLSE